MAAHILRPADPIPDSLNDSVGYPGKHFEFSWIQFDSMISFAIWKAARNATERLAIEKRKSKSKPKSKVQEISKSKTKSKTVESGAEANLVTKSSKENTKMKPKSAGKILELAIFVDEAAVNLFMPYLGQSDYVKLRELILAFVNGVSLFYPSCSFQLLIQ